MLKVAVCDDNTVFLHESENMLRQDHRIEKITLYSDPDDLLNDISRSLASFELVLMDIDFKEDENGIQAAGEICRRLPDAEILYVTAYNERFSQQILLGDVQPAGYLVKPLQPELLSRYIDKIYSRRGSRIWLKLSIHGQEYSVPAGKIRYMESHNHTVTIYMEGEEELLVYDKLDSLLQKLPAVFIRCHKSYVVNMKRICRLDPDKAVLEDGIMIPVSRANRAKVRERFFQYIGEETA